MFASKSIVCASIVLHALHLTVAADAVPATSPAHTANGSLVRFQRVLSVGGPSKPLKADTRSPNRVVFDDRGSVLMAATDRTVQVWSVAKMERVIPPITLPEGVVAADLDADGKMLLLAGPDGWLEVRSLATNTAVWRRRHTSIRSAGFTAALGGCVMVVEQADATVRIFDAATGRLSLTVGDDGSKAIASARTTADGKRLITDGDLGPTRVWSTTTGDPVATLAGGNQLLAISVDGERIAQARADDVIVSDARTGKQVCETKAYTRRDLKPAHVHAIAFSRDGRSLAIAAEDQGVRLFDSSTGLPTSEPFESDEVEGLLFSPDGRQLFATNRRRVAVFDVASRQRLATIEPPIAVHQSAPVAVAMSPDGRYLAVNFGGPLELWERRSDSNAR